MYFLLTTALALLAMRLEAQNLTKPNVYCPGGISVNTYTGNMYLNRQDLIIPGRIPLDISFSYNSADRNRQKGFGRGWIFKYGAYYQMKADTITIVHSDGRRDNYKRDPQNTSRYIAPKGIFDSLSFAGVSLRLRMKNGMVYRFENPQHKRISRMIDRNGNQLTFTYSDSLITQINDDAGRSIQLSYQSGLLKDVTEANGSPVRKIQYGYDAGGNLTTATDAMGFTRKYGYVTNGPMNIVEDKNANVTNVVYTEKFAVKEVISCITRHTFSYSPKSNTTYVTELVNGVNQVTTYKFSASGNLTQKTGNCCGYNTRYEYDADNNIYKMTDANGNIYTYTYDASGNTKSETDPDGKSILYSYDPVYNQITLQQDKKGNQTSFEYDSKGNLIKIIKPLSNTTQLTYNAKGDPITITDPRGNTTTLSYNSYGDLTSVQKPLSVSMSMTFDARGRKLSSTDPRGNTETYQYDLLNRLTKVTDPISGTLVFTFDGNSNLLTLKNKNNRTFTYEYDALDRLVKTSDPLGKLVKMSYDSRGNVTSFTNKLGNTYSYTYDQFSQKTSETNPLGEVSQFAYDGNGNNTSISLPNGNSISLSYDKLNRLISGSDNLGALFSRTYDANNNLIQVLDGNGNGNTMTYDALNRLTTARDQAGNAFSFAYDANRNLVSYADRMGRIYTMQYDALNRKTQLSDPLSNLTRWEYDPVGNLKKITDANNNATQYSYDALNRKVQENYADGSAKTYGYDAAGNLISRLDGNGVTTTFEYDFLNRLTKRDLPGSNDDLFTYDAEGRLLSAINSSATLSFSYDALDRMTKESQNDKSTTYSYNTVTKSKILQYPSGKTIIRKYDFRKRLVQIEQDGSVIAKYSLDNSGRTMKLEQPTSGSSVSFNYNNLNQIISMLNTPSPALAFSYEYDKEGNKLFEQKNHNPGASEQYSYDAINRLTSFKLGIFSGANITSPTKTIDYQMDGVGNRNTVTENGVSTTYTKNSVNAYTAIDGPISLSLQYDGNGNMTNDGVRSLTYNADNRLVSVNNGATGSYTYDAIGRRISKTISGLTSNYIYSGNRIIEEYNGSTLFQTFAYGEGIDEVLTLTKANGRTYTYLYNQLGSVAGLSNEAGQLVERYEYDPFGKVAISDSLGQLSLNSQLRNPFLYTGRQFDAESGIFQYRYRDYNSDLGRFKQRDPLGFIDDFSTYSYVKNNPLNSIDPFGLFVISCEKKAKGNIGPLSGSFSRGLAWGSSKDADWATADYTKKSSGAVLQSPSIGVELGCGFSGGNIEDFGGESKEFSFGFEIPLLNLGLGVSFEKDLNGNLGIQFNAAVGAGGIIPIEFGASENFTEAKIIETTNPKWLYKDNPELINFYKLQGISPDGIPKLHPQDIITYPVNQGPQLKNPSYK